MLKTILALVRIKNQVTNDPQLELRRTQRQERAITNLSNFIYNTNPCDHEDHDEQYDLLLDEHLHELLEALFYQELMYTKFIACPTDVTLILLSLRADGSFVPASHIGHKCALQQYYMKATPVHSLRLHSAGESKYVPFSATAVPIEDDEIMADHDEGFLKYVANLQVSLYSIHIIIHIGASMSSGSTFYLHRKTIFEVRHIATP
jgi:hypothetical protein